ncbi:MAG: hypothetical protein AAF939_22735, partial [Planctomycetota bacterium]
KDLLHSFREGAKLPRLGLELKSNPKDYDPRDFAALFPGQDQADFETNLQKAGIAEDALFGVLLPHVSKFRDAARMLKVDIRHAVELGDTERAVEDIETIFGLAQQASESPCLVCGLVGFAVSGLGFDSIEEVITSDPNFFAGSDLSRIQATVENLQPRDWIDYSGEKASIKDLIQRCYTDNGDGDGRLTPAGLDLLNSPALIGTGGLNGDDELSAYRQTAEKVFGPAIMMASASRKELTSKADYYLDLYNNDKNLPFWASLTSPSRDEMERLEKDLTENATYYFVLNKMFPAAQTIRIALDRVVGRQEGIVAALAIHRFYQANGSWPESVDDIAPEFVAEFPQDPFDGSLLKLKYDDDAMFVYSIGRNFEDDGGEDHAENGIPMPRSQIQFGPKSDKFTGDWILWPQLEENALNGLAID